MDELNPFCVYWNLKLLTKKPYYFILKECNKTNYSGLKTCRKYSEQRTVYYHEDFDSETSSSEVRNNQGRRGQWTVYYTSHQSFVISVSYSIANNLRDV